MHDQETKEHMIEQWKLRIRNEEEQIRILQKTIDKITEDLRKHRKHLYELETGVSQE